MELVWVVFLEVVFGWGCGGGAVGVMVVVAVVMIV